MNEILRDIGVIMSLSLTPPTVLGCAGVAILWWRPAMAAWKNSHKSETHWFVLGVTIGFVGSFFDNVYWMLAWSADYLELPARDSLFANGSFPNILFRQICTSIAAFCHIRAAVASNSAIFRLFITASWVIGAVTAVALFVIGDLG